VTPPLRVLVADDHPAYRAGLRLMLSAAVDVEVSAEADTDTRAVEVASASRPDVVIMDCGCPVWTGLRRPVGC
jgi:DNA-binding NarL/FixJ family response regulator